MLKILCCVKQVPDISCMEMDEKTGTLVRKGIPSITDPCSVTAVSASVEIKKRFGGEITLITMGPPDAEKMLRDCLAMGCDKAVLLTDGVFGNADTLASSYSIFKAAEKTDKYDIIVCGKESLDGATGQMPAQLAQRFDASILSSCTELCCIDEEKRIITVRKKENNYIVEARSKLPCVITAEKESFAEVRPTLFGKIYALHCDVKKIRADDIEGLDTDKIGDPGSPTKVPRMFPPKLHANSTMLNSVEKILDVQEVLK